MGQKRPERGDAPRLPANGPRRSETCATLVEYLLEAVLTSWADIRRSRGLRCHCPASPHWTLLTKLKSGASLQLKSVCAPAGRKRSGFFVLFFVFYKIKNL